MKVRTGAMEARPEAMQACPEAMQARPEAMQARPGTMDACPEAMEAALCSLTYDLKRFFKQQGKIFLDFSEEGSLVSNLVKED